MSQSFHIMMKVSTVFEMLGNAKETKQLVKMFQIQPDQIRSECEELIKQGKLYLPTEGCTTTDPTGKCNGHPEKVAA